MACLSLIMCTFFAFLVNRCGFAPLIPGLTFGPLLQKNFTFGESVRYYCVRGKTFDPQGKASNAFRNLNCLVNGTWSSRESLTCRRKVFENVHSNVFLLIGCKIAKKKALIIVQQGGCVKTTNRRLDIFRWPGFTLSFFFLIKNQKYLRTVKPCPGVPGIHLNAEYTVSMTAALLCGTWASPVHKVSPLLGGSRSDRGPRAWAKTCLGEVAMVKKWRPRTSCTACSSKKTAGCQRLLRRSCKVCLFASSWARITFPMYWRHV